MAVEAYDSAELKIYEGANHGFGQPKDAIPNAKADTIAFLDAHTENGLFDY